MPSWARKEKTPLGKSSSPQRWSSMATELPARQADARVDGADHGGGSRRRWSREDARAQWVWAGQTEECEAVGAVAAPEDSQPITRIATGGCTVATAASNASDSSGPASSVLRSRPSYIAASGRVNRCHEHSADERGPQEPFRAEDVEVQPGAQSGGTPPTRCTRKVCSVEAWNLTAIACMVTLVVGRIAGLLPGRVRVHIAEVFQAPFPWHDDSGHLALPTIVETVEQPKHADPQYVRAQFLEQLVHFGAAVAVGMAALTCWLVSYLTVTPVRIRVARALALTFVGAALSLAIDATRGQDQPDLDVTWHSPSWVVYGSFATLLRWATLQPAVKTTVSAALAAARHAAAKFPRHEPLLADAPQLKDAFCVSQRDAFIIFICVVTLQISRSQQSAENNGIIASMSVLTLSIWALNYSRFWIRRARVPRALRQHGNTAASAPGTQSESASSFWWPSDNESGSSPDPSPPPHTPLAARPLGAVMHRFVRSVLRSSTADSGSLSRSSDATAETSTSADCANSTLAPEPVISAHARGDAWNAGEVGTVTRPSRAGTDSHSAAPASNAPAHWSEYDDHFDATLTGLHASGHCLTIALEKCSSALLIVELLLEFLYQALPSDIATPRPYLSCGIVITEVMMYVFLPMVNLFYFILAFDERALLQEKLNMARNQAAVEAQASDAIRRFLRYTSHELRVPLQSITLGLSLLAKSPAVMGSPNDTAQFVDMMRSATDNMTTIMNSVLTLSAIEAGHFHLEQKPTNFDNVIERALYQFQPWARDIRASLSADVASDIPPCVLMDGTRVLQVIANLISNALKFVPPEGGTVHVRVRRMESASPVRSPATAVEAPSEVSLSKSSDGSVWLRLEVTDNGCGISEEEQRKLFTAFHQIQSGVHNKAYQSTGLGLAIAHEIVARHGGYMGCKSQVGNGSTFYFAAPFKVCDVAQLPDAASQSPLTAASIGISTPPSLHRSGPEDDESSTRASSSVLTAAPTRVRAKMSSEAMSVAAAELASSPSPSEPMLPRRFLLVDDSAMNRRLLAALIRRVFAGARVDEVADGAQAVRFVEDALASSAPTGSPAVVDSQLIPDVICMDREMPIMNGEDATRAIRAAGFQGLVVGVTGSALQEDQNLFMAAGCDDIAIKPIRMDAFKKQIEKNWARRSQPGSNASAGNAQPSTAAVAGAHLGEQ